MDIEKNQLDTDSVSIIVFKPYNQNYYSYTINGLENKHLLDRGHIYSFLKQFSESITSKLFYLTDRFLPFIYVKESNEIIELDEASNDIPIDPLMKYDTSAEAVPLHGKLQAKTQFLQSLFKF